MAKAIRTEHAGGKNHGGYWGTRAEAKARSNRIRRVVDQSAGRQTREIDPEPIRTRP
jgi:hypothetical protein